MPSPPLRPPDDPTPSSAAAVRLWTLGSGSQGNAVLVAYDGRRILLDAGFDLPELVARIRDAGIAPAEIDDVVLTHGHRDHVLGAAAGARTYGWRLWGTLGTVWRWRALRDVPLEGFEPGETIEAPPFRFHTAPTPHDVDDSVAIVVEVAAAGVRIGYCTDLGSAPEPVRRLLVDLDALVLESNYDPAMLAAGTYPEEVRVRVGGSHGHLANEQAAALAREAVSARTAVLVLGHISRHNNTPDLAVRTMAAALSDTPFRGTLVAAAQHEVAGPWRLGRATSAHSRALPSAHDRRA